MPRKTIYCAVAFLRGERGLEPDQPEQYSTPERAMRAGRRLAATAPGASVVQLDGWTEEDVWGEPRVLASWGQAPL